MSEYKRYTPEQIEQAKNADLADFVRSHGFDCVTVGKEIHVKNYGGLYINPQKNVFTVFSQSKADGSPEGGKGALAFCQKIMGMSFKDAMQIIVGDAAEIKQFTPKSADTPKEKIEFKMPEKSDNQKKVYAYLINQRKLSPQTISDFIKQGVLYQGFTEFKKQDGSISKHENAIFLHRNEKGEPCGADVQGIYSEARFKGIIPPDETDKGFVYTKGDTQKIDTVYIFEAPIDLMSFVELHPEIENAKFVAMGGLKPTIADHYINSGMNVVSCVDNDAHGQAFNNRILKEKMQDSLSMQGGTDVEHKSCKDREPPIEFLNAEVNGKKVSFFISRTDYADAKQAGADIEQAAFVWINRSNFTVNRECAEAGVKDFNDLLKSTKEVDLNEQTKNFAAKLNKISEWCTKTQEVITEQRQQNEKAVGTAR